MKGIGCFFEKQIEAIGEVMKKVRVLTLILALLMTLSVFSFSAFAEGENDPTTESESSTTTTTTQPAVDYKVEGDWQYKVIDKNTVQIVGFTGKGEECVIPENIDKKPVVSVAKGIVMNNSTIVRVTIPSTVKSFNAEAFIGCTALKEITVKSGAMEKFNIKYCQSLEIINLPDSVKSIGKLENCSMLQEINVADKNATYKSEDGIVYKANMRTLVRYPAGRKASRLVLPKTLVKIADYAFYYVKGNVKEIFVPSTVTKMGSKAFVESTPKLLFQAAKAPEGCATAIKGMKAAYSQVHLEAPKKVTSTVTEDTITLTWDKVDGATGYRVYMKVNGSWKRLASIPSSTVVLKGLKKSTKYTFAIKPYAKVVSGNSSVVSFAPKYKSHATATTPSATTKITATKGSATIKLKWSKVADADGYAIYRKTTKGWKHYKNVTGNSITIKGLKSYTSYTYAVKTYFKADKTITGKYKTITVRTDLGKPAVTAKQNGKDVISVKWDKVNGATEYQVYYRFSDTDSWKLLKTQPGNTVDLKLTGIQPGAKVSLAIRSIRKESGKTVAKSGYDPVTVTIKKV